MDGSILSSHRELGGRVLITDFHSVPVEEGGGHREVRRRLNTRLFQLQSLLLFFEGVPPSLLCRPVSAKVTAPMWRGS